MLTGVGVILGTAAYMIPEQARGKVVDKRADNWAFGCVLFEMLTGTLAFHAEDVSLTLAEVMKSEPDWSRLPAVPPVVEAFLKQCLRKDPRQRTQAIGDVRLALEGAFETTAPQRTPPAATEAPRGRLAWMVATAAMTVVAGVALWGWLTPASSEPRLLTHFTTAAPEGVGTSPIAVSRDGTHLAFNNAALNKIYIRAIDDPVATPVPGTEGGTFPAFSPDGQSLAFIAGSAAPYQLKKVPIAGGASLTLVGDIALAVPMTWGDDGNILLGGPVLRRVSEAGGTPMATAKVDAAAGEMFFAAPQLLPGGKYILADIATTKGLSAFRAVAVDVATGKMTTLLDGVGVNVFAPTGVEPGVGHLVYGLNGSLFAAAFNAVTLHVGPVAPVLEGTRNVGGLTPIGFSRSGTLAYPGRDSVAYGSPTTLMWVDRQGTEQPLTAPSRQYASPRISQDGGRVAFVVNDTQTLDLQLWVLDLARGTTTRLTFEGANGFPVWTADGKRLIYISRKSYTSSTGTLVSVAADGSGQPVTLMGEGATPAPTSVSPDGKLVIGVRAPGPTRSGHDIWVLPLEGDAKPQPFLDSRFTRGDLQFSPDGKWVAYESNEGGRIEIYVVPYPGPGGKSQVSTDGGTQPRWNRNGRELFFRSGARMMAVDVETAASFQAGAARVLFERVSSDYDVAPDGKRFLMLKPSTTAGDSTEIHVIVNWFDDLRRRVPLPK